MTSARDWVAGARVRTLPAALAPVLAGTGAAAAHSQPHVGRFLLAVVVAVGLQVAVNYANDYSDGVRGTDTNRVGPMRLVGSGRATAGAVKRAALIAAGVACGAGVALTAWSGLWWLIAVGGLCLLAAWGYTGGPAPYGYWGFGEVMVFVFFGPVAGLGTQITQCGVVTGAGVAASVACGAMSTAILLANNIRDVAGDVKAGKRTVAVRIGDRPARWLFVGVVVAAVVAVFATAGAANGVVPLLGLFPMFLMVPVVRDVLDGARGVVLIEVLQRTSAVTGWLGLMLACGLAATNAAG